MGIGKNVSSTFTESSTSPGAQATDSITSSASETPSISSQGTEMQVRADKIIHALSSKIEALQERSRVEDQKTHDSVLKERKQLEKLMDTQDPFAIVTGKVSSSAAPSLDDESTPPKISPR